MRKVRMTGVEPAIPKAANFKFAVYFQFHHTRVKKVPPEFRFIVIGFP